jgi:hypothetical protein
LLHEALDETEDTCYNGKRRKRISLIFMSLRTFKDYSICSFAVLLVALTMFFIDVDLIVTEWRKVKYVKEIYHHAEHIENGTQHGMETNIKSPLA